MKKLIRVVCVILVCSMVLALPAYAESPAEPRGSIFFSSYSTGMEKVSSTAFRVWFDVTANAARMDILGTSEIKVYRSSDKESWIGIKTFKKANYSQMVDENTGFHAGYVLYDIASPGYYYRARVTFYAKNSAGVGERDVYTAIIKM